MTIKLKIKCLFQLQPRLGSDQVAGADVVLIRQGAAEELRPICHWLAEVRIQNTPSYMLYPLKTAGK